MLVCSCCCCILVTDGIQKLLLQRKTTRIALVVCVIRLYVRCLAIFHLPLIATVLYIDAGTELINVTHTQHIQA